MSKKLNSPVVKVLNDILSAELTAINQYFLHAELCNHWGFKKLHDFTRKQSIDEMKHAELLIERILYLDGIPNVQRLEKINIGENVTEMMHSDAKLEREAIPRLNKAVEICRTAEDNGSRILVENILVSEEEHIEWLDTQLDLIEQLGEKNYLAQQM